jgi:hypothetical protein
VRAFGTVFLVVAGLLSWSNQFLLTGYLVDLSLWSHSW